MALTKKKITADFCVIGGGMAGISAAITAARLGVKTVLIQERPVFGGNASGEIRMWICGVKDYRFKETGIAEELNLENYYFNPTKNFNLWNALLNSKVKGEKNITSLLNCTCFDACTEGDEIRSVTAYQMTTQTVFEVEAKLFADCSGDSITAPLTGAHFMYGRESAQEYDEPMHTHSERDMKTMGNSCLMQARRTSRKVPFRAPDWAEKVSVEKLRSRGVNLSNPYENFWYIEIGGNDDVIGNAENINQKLLALCLGIWDTIKNSGEFDADNYELDFLGFLAAKRESRRMKGDYVLTAKDIVEGKIFPDTVAYGGWPLDDHNPDGFYGDLANHNIFLSKPYGIPYRCLYSENIKNLFFAGRNISLTHMAMSSARVMGTCTTIGQAVGAAAYLADKYGCDPGGVGEKMDELQQLLLTLDCWLPGVDRKVSGLTLRAALSAPSVKNADLLRNGKDRDLCGKTNRVFLKHGVSAAYTLHEPAPVRFVKIVFDSDLLRESFGDMHECEKIHSMRCNTSDEDPVMFVPTGLAKSFELRADGKKIFGTDRNLSRNLLIPVGGTVSEISLTVKENWGGTDESAVFTFELI